LCGDAWAVSVEDDRLTIQVADGLGHGLHASEAARAAVGVAPSPSGGCDRVLENMHLATRHTRGAAGAVARLRLNLDTMAFAGLGNVAGLVLSPGQRRQTVSANGTLGFQAKTFREYTYPWPFGAMLVLYTDGLTSHWAADIALSMRQHHPSLIAAALYRDFWRGRDDVTVVVAKEIG
jgi:hypothetical protein